MSCLEYTRYVNTNQIMYMFFPLLSVFATFGMSMVGITSMVSPYSPSSTSSVSSASQPLLERIQPTPHMTSEEVYAITTRAHSSHTPHTPLPSHEFIQVVNHTALVSVDLLLEYNANYFMGIRTNSPARGYWFNPGVRLYKNEHPQQGIHRLLQQELGIAPNILRNLFKGQHVAFNGVFEHAYPHENFMDVSGVSTQYYTFAYHMNLSKAKYDVVNLFIERQAHDAQHRQFAWIPVASIARGVFQQRRIHPWVQHFFDFADDLEDATKSRTRTQTQTQITSFTMGSR